MYFIFEALNGFNVLLRNALKARTGLVGFMMEEWVGLGREPHITW